MWHSIYQYARNLRVSSQYVRQIHRQGVLFFDERRRDLFSKDGRTRAFARASVRLRRTSCRISHCAAPSRLSRLYFRRNALRLFQRISRFRRADRVRHLLFDALFLCSATLALERAKHFSFCGDAFFGLSREFALALAIAAFICLLEMLLLAALFHPLGNIL